MLQRNEYEQLQSQIDEAVKNNQTDEEKRLYKKRMKFEVGYKTSDYESEDEIRIIYYAGDESNSSAIVPHLNFSAESGRLRAYISRRVKIGQTLTGLYVTIGPRVPKYEASHWKMMADWTVRQLGLSGSRSTCQSKLAYVG